MAKSHTSVIALLISALLVYAAPAQGPAVSADPHDWPMYNRDVLGTRHNAAEKTLGKDNAGKLVEKWRFPPADAREKFGVVHAVVAVNGYVYCGTETFPAFYKLTPDGKLKWVYRQKDLAKHRPPLASALSFGLPTTGFINAALVTGDTVYVGDAGGFIFALDRATGAERWVIDTRAKPFASAHPSNCVFASPILVEGKVIVAGGAFEHGVAANPFNSGCTGRGFVVALEPQTGDVVWKYDVGPEPREFDVPVTIESSRGKHVFRRGPSTSSVWCTPSYDAETHSIYFGTDCHNSPRQPTPDDPSLSTKHSCAVIALDARSGKEKWVTQITPGDVWNYALPTYDPKTGRYKDQSIGDTPKPYWILWQGRWRRVVGVGSKNGGFYILDAETGEVLAQTPIYTGPPVRPPENPHPRTLALPSAIGGLQTGCATDGKNIFTNGIDILGLGLTRPLPPTAGRVVSLSLDTSHENWRHERPLVPAVGGTPDKPAFTNVGDPVASGIAVANGVLYFTTTVSNKLVAVDAATGKSLFEIPLGPVWCGPIVSRGRVYVGGGNLLFQPGNAQEDYFPKSTHGSVRSFGLPEEDEVDRMKSGDER